MKYELHEIPISKVVEDYKDNAEEGCFAYGGKLNIRPPYQREFIYSGKKREAVIDSVKKGLPISVMYWIKKADGNFEVLDGQQRTISICQYVTGVFSIAHLGFKNLMKSEQEQILNYKLAVFICEGTDKETLEWFKVINTPGTELNKQELRNAILPGPWLNDAKKYFSKNNCSVLQLKYNQYLDGSAIRQDFLETALKWISTRDKISIEEYMAKNQFEQNCNELWLYFKKVMDWVKATFPTHRREMKNVEWGILYNKYGAQQYDTNKLEAEIVSMLEDEDITNSRGIYEYLFDRDERHLSIRKFSDKIKRAVYERQDKRCAKCGKSFPLEKMHADHITPWSKGGHTVIDNCQVLCENCNRIKSDV